MTIPPKIRLKYKMHPGQKPFHRSRAKNRIWIGGRQSGKTKAGANEAIKLAIRAGKGSVGFVVAPTYWHTQRAWREILRILTSYFNILVKDVNRSEHCITLIGDRKIWFKSAEDPDGLRSESLNWAWIDECALIKEEAWHAIEPALYGPAIFTSTPKGHNWVFELWTRGQDKVQTEYESWAYPTSINPYYPKEKIEQARKTLPDLVFRQEYLGEFIEDIGAVFRNVQGHVKPLALTPSAGVRYVVGCDLAKHEDFTVLIALDDRGEVHGFDRFQQLDWVFQRRRIVEFVTRYNSARLLLDSTGVGDPIYDELQRSGISVDGYKFTNASKADLVENLSIMLDDDKISYPEIPELINELRLFGYEMGKTGTKTYRAPEGYNDDCVIALALAAWQLKEPTGGKWTVSFGKRPR